MQTFLDVLLILHFFLGAASYVIMLSEKHYFDTVLEHKWEKYFLVPLYYTIFGIYTFACVVKYAMDDGEGYVAQPVKYEPTSHLYESEDDEPYDIIDEPIGYNVVDAVSDTLINVLELEAERENDLDIYISPEDQYIMDIELNETESENFS